MSQKQQVLTHLQKRGSITPLEALNKYSAYRLSAIILELRRGGYPIETNLQPSKTSRGKYAKYEMKKGK